MPPLTTGLRIVATCLRRGDTICLETGPEHMVCLILLGALVKMIPSEGFLFTQLYFILYFISTTAVTAYFIYLYF